MNYSDLLPARPNILFPLLAALQLHRRRQERRRAARCASTSTSSSFPFDHDHEQELKTGRQRIRPKKLQRVAIAFPSFPFSLLSFAGPVTLMPIPVCAAPSSEGTRRVKSQRDGRAFGVLFCYDNVDVDQSGDNTLPVASPRYSCPLLRIHSCH